MSHANPADEPQLSIFKTGAINLFWLVCGLWPWFVEAGGTWRTRTLTSAEGWPLRIALGLGMLYLLWKSVPLFVAALESRPLIKISDSEIVLDTGKPTKIRLSDLTKHSAGRSYVTLETRAGKTLTVPTMLLDDSRYWHRKIVAELDEKVRRSQSRPT